MSEQAKKALARVIEPGASEPASKRPTVEQVIPQLKRYDQEFEELPWPAKQLIFTFTEPRDMQALCSASKLFSQYCKSVNMEDFWRQRIAEKLELQKILDAARPFKRKKQAWTQNWFLMKPIAQWTLEDMNAHPCTESLWVRPGFWINSVTSWFQAWARVVKNCTDTEWLDALIRELESGPDANSGTNRMRALFLGTKILDQPEDDAYLNNMLDILAEWNWRNSSLGEVQDVRVNRDDHDIEMSYVHDGNEISLYYSTVRPEVRIYIAPVSVWSLDSTDWIHTFPASELQSRIYHIDRYIANPQ